MLAIDVTTIAQAILNRAGWVSGNAMALVGDSSGPPGEYVDWTDFSNAAGVGAATLQITYTAGAPAITGTLAATLSDGYAASFTGTVQPLPPPVDQIDMHDGKPAEDHQANRDRAKREAADNLRKAVRRAYRKTNGLADEEPAPVEQPADPKELARAIQAEIKADGIVARLRDIRTLVAEYVAEMARLAQEAEDETAAIMLLLA
ncbi:hypothetical protein NKJ16_08585 [Mesorhizobium sp. M0179]|uniref:hypothetical protein n=1 Tax=Mesorhizobium sp. M0179 TaxID=2956905 RepID=UPI0033355544